MPLLARMTDRLRRRRAEVDQVWREATRQPEDAELIRRRQEDADRIRAEAHRTQAQARAEAFDRIFRQARGAS